MNEFFDSFWGLLAMFFLGVRHGFDPDHIACIDGYTWRNLDNNSRIAPWVGTLFALGHGLIVTLVAVIFGKVNDFVSVGPAFAFIFEWIPTALLLLIAALNLKQLLSKTPQISFKNTSAIIPEPLRTSATPLAMVVIGMLFATVFDSATQMSMWAYAATTTDSANAALYAGLAFTLGMVLTDTLDGRILCLMFKRANGNKNVANYRLLLGWIFVCISILIAFYNIANAIFPQIEINEKAYSTIGFFLVLLIISFCCWSYKGKNGPYISTVQNN